MKAIIYALPASILLWLLIFAVMAKAEPVRIESKISTPVPPYSFLRCGDHPETCSESERAVYARFVQSMLKEYTLLPAEGVEDLYIGKYGVHFPVRVCKIHVEECPKEKK